MCWAQAAPPCHQEGAIQVTQAPTPLDKTLTPTITVPSQASHPTVVASLHIPANHLMETSRRMEAHLASIRPVPVTNTVGQPCKCPPLVPPLAALG